MRSSSKRPESPAKRRNAAPAGGDANPRIARRERRREQSREEILEGARRVLMRSGIAATTLDAVAQEIGVTKTALYYYYPSKDSILFELVFRALETHARAVHDAVEVSQDGGQALRAIIQETVRVFAPRIDDFRLAFLQGQVAGNGALHFDAQQFARIRPLNELWYAGATKRLAEEREKRPGRAQVEPRLMAFLANLAAIGLLTMKGMVESVDDPLLYSDEQLVEGLARIFEAAAAP
jgi:AcrR family transcriptional regulator